VSHPKRQRLEVRRRRAPSELVQQNIGLPMLTSWLETQKGPRLFRRGP